MIQVWLGGLGGRFSPLTAPADLKVSVLYAIRNVILRDGSGNPADWVIYNPSQGKYLPVDSEQPISECGIRHGAALFLVPADLPEEVCSLIAGEILGNKYQQQRSSKALEEVETEIEQIIADCKWTEENIDSEKEAIWVIKFFNARYLESFLNSQQLLISTAPGFTWGDAVYVTLLKNPCSTMMYGRAGIMGYLPKDNAKRVFLADTPSNLRLYQQWITFHRQTFTLLTTTIHSIWQTGHYGTGFGVDFELMLLSSLLTRQTVTT
jgi:hypothetical protein